MKQPSKTIFFVAVSLVIVGCTPNINIKSVDSSKYKINEICIKRNEKVIVPEFIETLESGIKRHNIKTKLVSEVNQDCEFWLNYNATQRWDIVTFMADAHLELYKDNVLIGSADRNAPRGLFGFGGINPSKWNSTQSKVYPLIDELLKGSSVKR